MPSCRSASVVVSRAKCSLRHSQNTQGRRQLRHGSDAVDRSNLLPVSGLRRRPHSRQPDGDRDDRMPRQNPRSARFRRLYIWARWLLAKQLLDVSQAIYISNSRLQSGSSLKHRYFTHISRSVHSHFTVQNYIGRANQTHRNPLFSQQTALAIRQRGDDRKIEGVLKRTSATTAEKRPDPKLISSSLSLV